MKKIYLIIILLLLITPFSFARSLAINNYDINYNINENGIINVSETIEYSLKGVYSELYLQKPTSLKIINATGYCINKKCDFRHDLTNTPTGEQELVLKSRYSNDTVTVNFSYDIVNVINKLQDGKFQFYYFLYGKDTAYPTNLNISLKIPGNFKNTEYFIHSKDYNLEIIDNQMFISKKVFAHEPIEINLLMPSNYFIKTEYINQDNLTSAQVIELEENWQKEYKSYSRKYIPLFSKNTQKIIAILLIIFLSVFIFWVWKRHGRELSRKEVSFFQEYQRDIPYKEHDPILANFFLNEKFTQYWFSSAIMFLVWKGVYLLEKEDDDYFLKRTNKEVKVFPEIKKVDSFLKKYFKNKKFNVNEIEDRIRGKISFKKNIFKQSRENKEFQNSFLKLYKDIKQKTEKSFFDNKDYYIKKGKTIVGLFIVFYAAFILLTYIFLETRLSYFITINFRYLILLAIIFVVFYRHFGKFTKKGRIINLKWQGFKKYITDFSDIKNHPPRHVILWEEYLVYATAFGISKEVVKNIKTILPQEYNTNTKLAVFSGFVVSNSFSKMNNISSSGGSSGRGGGFGGGAGGGGAGGR
jgi:uncharacterized membrane protein